MSLSDLFVDVSSLPQNGYGLFQVIFMTLVYGAILFVGSNLISDGSELLLLVPSLSGQKITFYFLKFYLSLEFRCCRVNNFTSFGCCSRWCCCNLLRDGARCSVHIICWNWGIGWINNYAFNSSLWPLCDCRPSES